MFSSIFNIVWFELFNEIQKKFTSDLLIVFRMEKEIIRIKGIVAPASPFNHVAKAGNFILLSIQLSADLKVHKILGGDIRTQTSRALENVKLLLESAGPSMDNIIKVVIYMRDVKKDLMR
jgi:2-iminobutanoate/2-iminopropanoate deaminase